MNKQFYVYLMANHRGTLYAGVTNDLVRRVYEHRNKLVRGFTSRYNLTKLVYYETTDDIESAISREKQIKGWVRRRKVALIESMNDNWSDLAQGWYEAPHTARPFALAQGDEIVETPHRRGSCTDPVWTGPKGRGVNRGG